LSKNVGFIDIGTNSIRLALVQIAPNGAYTILSEQKETVRLGEDEFKTFRLSKDAIKRAVLVCQQFADMARSNNATEIIAVATSATREAKNRSAFISALKSKAKLQVKTISGIEEARLIFLGIADGFDFKGKQALLIDIGGGSTEVIVCSQNEYYHLESMKLGALRVTSKYIPKDTIGPISPESMDQIHQHILNTAIRPLQRITLHNFDLVVGSSGTIETLATTASQLVHGTTYRLGDPVQTDDLRQTLKWLAAMPLKERASLSGMNTRRADIIIGGGEIICTLLEHLALPAIHVTARTLRDGLLVDYLMRSEHASLYQTSSVRDRSVSQLAKKFGVDEPHARQVKTLALQLFDSAAALGLHHLKHEYRELLAYASILHDIGIFLSYSDHHKHSYYLVKNADLAGFNNTEIEVMAAAAFFHRKKKPKHSHPYLANLPKPDRQAVRVMATLLRIAEALDRSHQNAVISARFSAKDQKIVYLDIKSEKDNRLELWRLSSHNPLFARVFKKEFSIRQLDRQITDQTT
jgi:exopolyphosphatase/guanosine-5'-triphosphate,3'-diphosphate pyrophosphatase